MSNVEFAAFIDDTGHVTEAQRFGWSFVFAGLLPDDFEPTRAVYCRMRKQSSALGSCTTRPIHIRIREARAAAAGSLDMRGARTITRYSEVV